MSDISLFINEKWIPAYEVPLTQCRWSPNAAPTVTFSAERLEGALHFCLKSASLPLRTVNREQNTPVWEDDCLEFFLSADGIHYVNIEINSLGACYSARGTGRAGRVFLSEFVRHRPEVRAEVFETGWTAEAVISEECFMELFGKSLKETKILYGNFYACGDLNPRPYYASMFPILTETPDYHRPEYFGQIRI